MCTDCTIETTNVQQTGIMQLTLNFQREQDQSPQQLTTSTETYKSLKRTELINANIILPSQAAANPV